MRWTKEELAQRLKENPDLTIGPGNFTPDPLSAEAKVPVETKYHALPTDFGGRRYGSKKEAQYAADLTLRKQAGEVSWWLEQVPFPLPGVHTDKRGRKKRIVYRLDFLVFLLMGGQLVPVFVEVKGKDLPLGKLKRKQTEEIYHISIVVV